MELTIHGAPWNNNNHNHKNVAGKETQHILCNGKLAASGVKKKETWTGEGKTLRHVLETWLRVSSVSCSQEKQFWRRTLALASVCDSTEKLNTNSDCIEGSEKQQGTVLWIMCECGPTPSFRSRKKRNDRKIIFRKKVTGARARTLLTHQTQPKAKEKKNHIWSILLWYY